MQRHINKSPLLTLLLHPLLLGRSQPTFPAEHPSHPVCIFSGCSPANSQDGSSTSHCPNWAGLLDSLEWCWCFHFHLQITVVVALFWWSEQSKREKRHVVWIWSSHLPVFPKASTLITPYLNTTGTIFTDPFLTHCSFYPIMNFSLVQGGCIERLMDSMSSCHFPVTCVRSYYTDFKYLHCFTYFEALGESGPHSSTFPSKWLSSMLHSE